ncbi:exodeoxyribonuclease V subunit alpha [Thalassotalea fonticola]|uniref:RecBCD enzyme subunit RecD n=1 Tax=Thalassotalea fonticola TaxID=3065649 RepID=A0ABZ0GR54_9GAMM|nr:exodeoxyribonuclease V subunit alpha [Colwelliaceae bacterium S1-1]
MMPNLAKSIDNSSDKNYPPYQTFYQAEQNLDGLQAIDYYLACSLIEHSTVKTSLLFHLFLALSVSQRDGHSCLELRGLSNKSLWQVKNESVESKDYQALVVDEKPGFNFPDLTTMLATLNDVAIMDADCANQLVVLEHQQLYLRRYWYFEKELASFIEKKFLQSINVDNSQIEQIIQSLFPSTSNAVDWQLTSVANALNKTFSIIAGGPGTGKTYTVTKLLAGLLLQNEEIRIEMVAPTGKAAQRLSESIISAVNSFKQQQAIDEAILAKIPTTASTIHRLLGVIKNSPNFRHHQQNQLSIDVLLIDEVSMVDLPMMVRVFRALPLDCKVILLGDADQLPSVATGSVLADLAPWPNTQYSSNNKSFIEQVTKQQLPSFNKCPSMDYLTYLTLSRRFSGDGGIGKIAKLVITSKSSDSWQLLTEQSDNELDFIGDKPLLENIKRLTEQFYSPIYTATTIEQAFSILDRFRILVPTRVGEAGLENINLIVEQHLIKLNCIVSKQQHYHGKPIMISQNHYGVNLFNGDIGLIFKDNSGRLMAYFAEGENYRAISISRLPSFETVFAMTIHKTQGSEFENVALILPESGADRLLSRELIYTGITRAKKHLQIFCNKQVWLAGVTQKVSRASGLTKRLMSFMTDE